MRKATWLAEIVAVVVFCLLTAVSGANQSHQEGKLVVRVLLGDSNTPDRLASVYVQGYLGRSSSTLRIAQSGWFEIALEPGLYDVFVGTLSTLPMCKRVEIKPGHTKIYTAKPELDDDHLEN